jgi:hypothetical protein
MGVVGNIICYDSSIYLPLATIVYSKYNEKSSTSFGSDDDTAIGRTGTATPSGFRASGETVSVARS